jgi:hypothetical protein
MGAALVGSSADLATYPGVGSEADPPLFVVAVALVFFMNRLLKQN